MRSSFASAGSASASAPRAGSTERCERLVEAADCGGSRPLASDDEAKEVRGGADCRDEEDVEARGCACEPGDGGARACEDVEPRRAVEAAPAWRAASELVRVRGRMPAADDAAPSLLAALRCGARACPSGECGSGGVGGALDGERVLAALAAAAPGAGPGAAELAPAAGVAAAEPAMASSGSARDGEAVVVVVVLRQPPSPELWAKPREELWLLLAASLPCACGLPDDVHHAAPAPAPRTAPCGTPPLAASARLRRHSAPRRKAKAATASGAPSLPLSPLAAGPRLALSQSCQWQP
jgi:hypothetical protein